MQMRCAMISPGLDITFAQMTLHQIGLCFLKVEVLVTLLKPAIEGTVCVYSYTVCIASGKIA